MFEKKRKKRDAAVAFCSQRQIVVFNKNQSVREIESVHTAWLEFFFFFWLCMCICVSTNQVNATTAGAQKAERLHPYVIRRSKKQSWVRQAFNCA